MRIELNRRSNTIVFVTVSLVVATLYIFWVQNHYRAARYSEDISQSALEASVRLEPGNAEHRDLLGRFYLYALQDANRASEQLEEAVRADRNTSRYWLDLATAKGLLGKTDEQRAALQTALKVDPKTPAVAWEAGNFFLADGNTDAALDSFKTVLEYDPLALRRALDLSWRATHDVHKVLEHTMPAKVEPHLELMRILIEQKRTADAIAVWGALVRLAQPYKVSDVMPFVEYLIREHEIAAAQEMWDHMAKTSASLRPSGEGNLVVNGNFNEEIIPGGFSWRLQPPASQSIRVDPVEIHGGTASISFTFEGPTFSDYGFSQLVPVRPKQLYELRVAAKSQEIQSSDGPRIMVEDAFNHTLLAKGEEWQGTHGWDDQRVLFSTKPDTKLIRIYIGRVTGAGLIRGTLWLDNIQLFER
jgi:lipoprotein NlpI